MHDVHLAILWHQHQPYYPDDVTGENPMPWVRLHGTKDYWGMAQLLHEIPEFRATINLVPSLIVQLLKYEEGHVDDHLVRLAAAGRRAGGRRHALSARQFFHGPPDPQYPAAPTTSSTKARPGSRSGQPRGQAVLETRHPRSAVLVESGLDSPVGVRGRQGTEGLRDQGSNWSESCKSSGCWTGKWTCLWASDPAAQEAGRPWAN